MEDVIIVHNIRNKNIYIKGLYIFIFIVTKKYTVHLQFTELYTRVQCECLNKNDDMI